MNYALLVGINNYKSKKIFDLRGCEVDCLKMKTFFSKKFKDQVRIKLLLNEQATRENIIDGFRTYLGKAKRGERVIFYYSGHGSREYSPKEFLPFQGEMLHESIVCHDSRVDNVYDLADKEINHLIGELSRKEVEVIVILDCCHSGSLSRSSIDFSRSVRYSPPSEGIRPINSFIKGFSPEIENSPHVVLAACDNHEYAIENAFPEPGGVFTKYLLKILSEESRQISYFDLILKSRELVLSEEPTQTPQLYPYEFNAFKEFLGSEMLNIEDSFFQIVTINGRKSITIGSTHPGFTSKFEIGSGLEVWGSRNTTDKIGTVVIEEILPDRTYLKASRNFDFLPSENPVYVYVALVKEAKLAVVINGDQGSTITKDLKSDYSNNYVDWTDSTYAEEKQRRNIPIYELFINRDIVSIRYPGIDKNIISFTEDYVTRGFQQNNRHKISALLLDHIYRWERFNGLKNREVPQNLDVDSFSWSVSIGEYLFESLYNEEHEITIFFDYGISSQDIKIKFDRPRAKSLFFKFYYLSRKFEILKQLEENVFPIQTEDFGIILMNNQMISIPSERNSVVDIFKLVISEQPLHFFQPRQGSISNLLKVLTEGRIPPRRDLVEKEDRPTGKWNIKNLRIRSVKSVGIIQSRPSSICNGLLHFSGHPSFKANVSIISSSYEMKGYKEDKVLREKTEMVGAKLISFSDLNQRDTIIALHSFENPESLLDIPLIVKLHYTVSDWERIWAFTTTNTGNLKYLGQAVKNNDGHSELEIRKIVLSSIGAGQTNVNSMKVSFIVSKSRLFF